MKEVEFLVRVYDENNKVVCTFPANAAPQKDDYLKLPSGEFFQIQSRMLYANFPNVISVKGIMKEKSAPNVGGEVVETR
jgi:hypothetical protein